MTSSNQYLKTSSPEERELHIIYSAVVRERSSLNKEENKEKANTAAQAGMNTSREKDQKNNKRNRENHTASNTKYKER